ncbi:MAG: hypothetical protein JXM69_21810 [Anaerolineae bacterium]|nr:hypothetical protein [Anaerolineae bacterium]
MVKLLMSWDLKPGSESDYFEFAVREFIPGIMKLGIQPTEAWYTIFGDGPQIVTGGVAEDLAAMKSILASNDWQELRDKLFEYVTDFSFKIVRPTGKFQLL